MNPVPARLTNALMLILLLLGLSACGGGSAPAGNNPPPGNGGGGNGGGGNGGGGNGGGGNPEIPPVEMFQDLSPATDDNVTSWLKDAYHTLPAIGDADGVYQNVSLRAWSDDILTKVNEERAVQGKPALIRSAELDNVAQAHARDMALRDYFSHDSEDYGIDYAGRLDAVDPAPYNFMGENIAAGQSSPTAAMTTWMNSPPHRDNILQDNFEHMGVGVYYDAGGGPYTLYWVQVFARFNGDPEAHVWILP